MIPKVIHYCWFGRNPLPKDVKACIKSWKKHCPDYEIKRWDEDNFDINCHPFVKEAYEQKAWAFVSDYARLKVILDNGGIYFDTDVELLKSPDFLLEHSAFMGVEQIKKLCTTGLGFGAEKGNEVIQKMLKKYDGKSILESGRDALACPYLNSAVCEEYGYKYSEDIQDLEKIVIYPPRFFDPLSLGDTENLLCEDSVSIHHYAATWTSGKNRLKRKLFRFIGEDKIHKLKQLLKRVK